MQNDDFIILLEKEFSKNSNQILAESQSAYMRNKFHFYGLTAHKRRQIQNPIINEYLLSKNPNFKELIKKLWKKKQRDYQYCAQELMLKKIKQFKPKDIYLFEFIITNKSWWDTIDFLAPKILGEYFKLYPKEIEKCIQKWIKTNNIWLQRSCILFQLSYKSNLNTKLLSYIINSLLDSNEFFINKSIGWTLREYSKTNKEWVLKFVNKTKLNKLSHREALKFIKK